MAKVGDQEELIDLAVVGGGPAGTAAALEARRHGLSVTLWDRSRFPREKVCGEFLSAESLPFLESQIPATLARGSIIRIAEFISPRGRRYSFALNRSGRGLSRRLLDEALWRAAAASGAQTREGEAVRGLRKSVAGSGREPVWLVESAAATQKAKMVTVCCGRWWTLRGFPSPGGFARARPGPWVGAKAHFCGVMPRNAVEMYFFPGGYCGLAPIEDGLYNACCLVHRSLVRHWGATRLSDFRAWIKSVARHPALDARLRSATQTSKTAASAPIQFPRRQAERESALLAGDAAGFIDPFTGEGISLALQGGRLAARAIAECGSHRTAEGSPERVARRYERNLAAAAGRSYALAALLRVLVRAPASVQSAAATALPLLGTQLMIQTRWRLPG